MHEPPPPPLVTVAPSTTSTTTLGFANDMQRLLQVLRDYKFVLGDRVGFTKDQELAARQNSNFSIPAVFKQVLTKVRKAASASMMTGDVLAAMAGDADVAYQKALQFAANAAGAELNARQMFRIFRRQFSMTRDSSMDEYGSALAESYNAKSKERDRVLHEHEVESYILKRIRNKAQVSAANFTRVSTEIRRSLSSFSDALLSRALLRKECAATTVGKVKTWRTSATEQLRKCLITVATKQAIGAKSYLFELLKPVGARILATLKVLSKVAEEMVDLRARKPDIPVGKDFTLVRTWDDNRLAPMVKWAGDYSRVVMEHWLLLRTFNTTTQAQHDMMMGIFKRIDRGLHPTSSPLSPQKVSECCDAEASFVELSSQLGLRHSHQGHLRGRHSQQGVLRATPQTPVSAKSSGKPSDSKGSDAVLALAVQLDKFVNTGFVPQVQALLGSMSAIQESKALITAAAKSQQQAIDRVLESVKPSRKEHAALVILEAARNRTNFDPKVNEAEIAQARIRCGMLDLSLRVAQRLTALTADAQASADATATQAQAIDDLTKAWVSVTPYKVHQNMVDIAEKRELRILKQSGVHANISDARVHAIQQQIEALRSSNRLESSELKDWYDILTLAEKDADDGNGGERLRKVVADLLPTRAKAVAEIGGYFADLRNASENIVQQLERRVASKKKEYLSKIASQSESTEEVKLEEMRLREGLQSKIAAVKALEARLAKHKLEILDKQAEKAHGEELQPPLAPEEMKELTTELEQLQQTGKEIAGKLEDARVAVKAQQRKIDSMSVKLDNNDAQEKAVEDWSQRLDKILITVRELLRSSMSKLDGRMGIISTFRPPTPIALEKVVGKELPPEYAAAYNNVNRLTRVIELATLKIRVANVLHNKIALAKAYRDSEDLQLELVRIRDGMQGSATLQKITEAVPSLAQSVETFGNHLHTVLRAQIANQYQHELIQKMADDKRLSEPVPAMLKKAKADQEAVRTVGKTLAHISETRTRVQEKLDKARGRLDILLGNTTRVEERVAESLRQIKVQKQATITDILLMSEAMDRMNRTIPEMNAGIKGVLVTLKAMNEAGEHLKTVLTAKISEAASLCARAKRVASSVSSLSQDQKDLLRFASEEQVEKKLKPCEEAKAQVEALTKSLRKNREALETARAGLIKDQEKRASTLRSVLTATNDIAKKRQQLGDIAKAQAAKEISLDEAKRNTAKHRLLIKAAQGDVAKYADRDSTLNAEIQRVEIKQETARNTANESLAIATSYVKEHQLRRSELEQLRASYTAYKAADPDALIEGMSQQADRATELSGQLLKLLETLRKEQMEATDARIAVIRKLAQSIVNAFACTGCKTVDTAEVFERPPSDNFVDENQGEGWAEKLAMTRLYKEFASKARKFHSMSAPEKTLWKSFTKATAGLAEVMHSSTLLSTS